jgi:hypothetical protein
LIADPKKDITPNSVWTRFASEYVPTRQHMAERAESLGRNCEMSELVSFLKRRHDPCMQAICTTCGGTSLFFRDLETAITDSGKVAADLKELSAQEVVALEGRSNAIKVMLSALPDAERSDVLKRWVQRAGDDPRLAKGFLVWMDFGRSLSRQELEAIIKAASPELLIDRRVRDGIRWIVDENLPCPDALTIALGADEEEEKRRIEANAQKVTDRQNYFRALADMPFKQRVETIVGDKSIDPYRNWQEWQGWSSAWTRCDDSDIASLESASIQSLIDLCEGNLIVRSSNVLRKLYDRRHHLRQVAMDSIRHRYASLNGRELLNELVLDPVVPIEQYPVELAGEVSEQWLQSIPEAAKMRFVERLDKCKLRIWVGARRKLLPHPA